MTDENAAYQKAENGLPLALEPRNQGEDGRRFSPSIGRNRDVVRDAFLAHMPREGTVLEIAAGTGEHGVHITQSNPDLTWIYSDIDPVSLASQAAWKRATAPSARLLGPLTLDVTQDDWLLAGCPPEIDAAFCANMIHIAPIEATAGLIAGLGRHIRAGGRAMIYGPFARDGEIAPSNARFDADLRRRDPRWGVRDLERELLPLVADAGLSLQHVAQMPANNLSVILQRDG